MKNVNILCMLCLYVSHGGTQSSLNSTGVSYRDVVITTCVACFTAKLCINRNIYIHNVNSTQYVHANITHYIDGDRIMYKVEAWVSIR